MAKHSNDAPLQLPQRMAPSDALFWYAETAVPSFRPIIAGLYILDRHPDAQAIEVAHDVALAAVPRLGQRIVESPLPLGLPDWRDDPHFDRAYHIRHLSLAVPGTLRDLLDLTATVFATPLDRERPLWEAYWIDGLEGGRAAYFFKMHHSLVDGVGSLALLNALTQPSRGASRVAGGRRRPARPQSKATPGPAKSLTEGAVDNARELMALAWRAAGAPLRIAQTPAASADQLRRIVRGLRGLVTDFGAPVQQDPLVRSTSGLSRRFDILEIPLQRLHQIRKPLEVTINDLVLTALSGTLGTYHRERHVHADALTCMVPMNLRGTSERDTLGNRVGMFNITLPVGEKRPERRLDLIVRQTQAAKSDRRGALYPFLVQSLTMLPAAAFRWLALQSLGRVNVACTNIPGVPERRYIGGARVQAIYPFASVVQGTPLVMALFSYAGAMDIGIDTDPEAIPDPHRISELFDAGLRELEAMGTSGHRTAAKRIPLPQT